MSQVLPAQTAPQKTADGDAMIYNVSLKLVNCAKNNSCGDAWKTYFDHLASKAWFPDALTVLEVPLRMRDAVKQKLASALGTPEDAWGLVHVDGTGYPGCAKPSTADVGNTLILYRKAKFDLMDCHAIPGNKWTDKNACVYSTNNGRDLAVRLRERGASGNELALVATHISRLLGPDCILTNLDRINRRLETNWGALPFRVVAGDVNQPPQYDPNDGEPSGNDQKLSADERKEICPDDWYLTWSAEGRPYTDTPCGAQPGNGDYHDTIWITQGDEGKSDICDEWTADNQAAHSKPNACWSDGGNKMRKWRIDYIWLGTDVARTAEQLLPSNGCTTRCLVGASTDRGYHTDSTWSKRYSDHRSINVQIRW